jgi:hypothetical protein
MAVRDRRARIRARCRFCLPIFLVSACLSSSPAPAATPWYATDCDALVRDRLPRRYRDGLHLPLPAQ